MIIKLSSINAYRFTVGGNFLTFEKMAMFITYISSYLILFTALIFMLFIGIRCK